MSESELQDTATPGGLNTRRNSTFIIAGVGIVLLIALLFQWVLSDDTYLLDEAKWRSNRNEMFKNSPESPIPDSLRASFDSLDWYPVSRFFRVTADFEPNPKFEKIEMPRSQSTPETYIVAGWLHFKIGAVECKLTAYQPNPKDSKTLFVPFRDMTSGTTTYGGGRYIDTRRTDRKVPLDFNRAYNPYCVYNYAYACPVPPEQNRLPVAIEAGEKDFHWPGTTKGE